jgi:hypothetical protein
MTPSQDTPRLEVYPWHLPLLVALLWGGLWFFIWAALRGSVASLVIAFGSLQDRSYFPWLVPGQLVLWLASLAWVRRDLKMDRDPPLLAWALCLILLVTLPPTAFFMLGRISLLSDYELTHNATSLFFQRSLRHNILDVLTLVLCISLGAFANLRALRNKYPGLRPQKPGWIAAAWALAFLVAIPIGYRWGTLWGFLFMAWLGNSVAVHAYRKTIRHHRPPPVARM